MLDRMVEERVWLRRAARRRRAATPGQMRARSSSRSRDLLIRTYVNEVMAYEPAHQSDAEAQAYYDAHLRRLPRPGHGRALSHIQLEGRGSRRAEGAQAARRRKRDWEKLVAASTRPTR